MRNAVIVAAGDCVVFMLALISANTYLAIAVVGLSVAGLLLVARDWRAQRDRGDGRGQPHPRTLTPDDFTPDVTDGDDSDATTPATWADEQGGNQPGW
jgi:hypothetical protein